MAVPRVEDAGELEDHGLGREREPVVVGLQPEVPQRSQTQDDAEDVGPTVNSNDPVHFNKDVASRNRGRKPTDIITLGTKTEKERQIESRLNSPQTLNFTDTPCAAPSGA